MSFILALDQGTTSSRAIVFDHDGCPRACAQQEFTQHFPRDGWVEHDATEIWATQLAVAAEALAQAGLTAKDVAAMGITNQRETTVIWDRRTGEPIHRAIVWQDRRGAELCRRFERDGLAELIRHKTGLVLDAYFCASKLRWLLDHVPNARVRAEAGELAFGTIDTWLLWQLTGGEVHLTDASNASRTLLFNLHTGDWDDQLLTLWKIPRSLLPEVRTSSEVYGHTRCEGLPDSIPIAAMAGDQQAALFGQAAFRSGVAKNTYGTGCFVLMNVGEQPTTSRHRLLSTVAWRLGEQTTYALEGSVFIAGAVVQWLRDGLGLIDSAARIEPLAASVPDNGGVYFVPAFAGLGAPHWDPHARGTIVGLTRGTTAGHLARAALESIAYQTADVLDAMSADAGTPIPELRVDGGAAANDLLMQFQADLLGVPLVRPKVIETTALGAAGLAGLAVGYWTGLNDIAAHWQTDRVFEPAMSRDQATHLRGRWRAALDRARDWDKSQD